MKKKILLPTAILAIIKLHASSLTTLNEEEVHAPVVTYDQIRENSFLDKQWGKLQLEGEKWHFHWALLSGHSLEEKFSPENYGYEIVLIDSSGLRSPPAMYRFASYRVEPKPKDVSSTAFVHPWLPHFFTFYLIDPKTCRMDHGH